MCPDGWHAIPTGPGLLQDIRPASLAFARSPLPCMAIRHGVDRLSAGPIRERREKPCHPASLAASRPWRCGDPGVPDGRAASRHAASPARPRASGSPRFCLPRLAGPRIDGVGGTARRRRRQGVLDRPRSPVASLALPGAGFMRSIAPQAGARCWRQGRGRLGRKRGPRAAASGRGAGPAGDQTTRRVPGTGPGYELGGEA